MAIDADVENEYGAVFKYHKLREVRVINDDNAGVQLTMTVYSWLNKQARIDGKQPTVRQCIIDNADFAMSPFYALLKAKFESFDTGLDDMDNAFKATKEPPARPQFIEQTAQGRLLRRKVETPAGRDVPADAADTPDAAAESPTAEGADNNVTAGTVPAKE